VIQTLLASLLGKKGHEALQPLLKTEELASFIVPRTVIAFLKGSVDGSIVLQGFEFLSKKENAYSGSVEINSTSYEFSNANETEVAAIVSVLNNQVIASDVKGLDLAKLSKTIDLLVKSQQQTIEPKEPDDSYAKPKEPMPPIPKLAPTNNRVKRNMIKTMMVPHSSSKICKMCKKQMFEDKSFTGCTCLKALAKSVTSQTVAKGILLSFGPDLDQDAVCTLVEAIND
jgi:hypothetical protein